MAMNGFYPFLNWFDKRAWYPLGRIVGGTVSYRALEGRREDEGKVMNVMHRAIPLFNYTPLQMTINGVQGGYREYVPGGGGGGGHLNPCPGGLEGIIEACPGGSGTT